MVVLYLRDLNKNLDNVMFIRHVWAGVCIKVNYISYLIYITENLCIFNADYLILIVWLAISQENLSLLISFLCWLTLPETFYTALQTQYVYYTCLAYITSVSETLEVRNFLNSSN